ncbi:MAG: alkaline phosphatase family protein [Acidobacteriota bacterium]
MDLKRALYRLVTVSAIAVASPAAGADPAVATPGRRVVVVSFDGAGGFELRRRLAAGFFSPDGFARAAREGEAASRLEIVTPSLTAVSHIALATGAPPSRTGIVGNTFHLAGTSLRERRRGFDVDPETETLWEAAARQGKRVISMGFPGASQHSARSRTALSLHYNEVFPKATFWKGSAARTPFTDVSALPAGVVSFSPAKRFDLESLPFLLLDSTDDGETNYDTLVVLGADGGVRARAHPGEWFPLSERRDAGAETGVLFGRWSKVLALTPDLSAVALYLGDVFHTEASPSQFRRAIEARAGFWPGLPDANLLKGADPDVSSFLEQARRLTRYFVHAFEVADQRADWDLLLAYIPILDTCNHYLLLTDPANPSYSKERAARAAAGLDDAWRSADEAAARFLECRGKDDVFLVSDHGFRAMNRSISPAAILVRAGLLKVVPGAGGRLETAPDSPLDFIWASGGTGFVVVNRVGLPGGVVPEDEADEDVSKAAAVLRETRDERGERVFAVVANRAEAVALGVSHPNMGDLILIAAGPRNLRGGLPAAGDLAALGPPEIPGQHGYGADPALDGLYLHVGDGVAPASLGVVRELDVAGLVAARLGIAPPGQTP